MIQIGHFHLFYIKNSIESKKTRHSALKKTVRLGQKEIFEISRIFSTRRAESKSKSEAFFVKAWNFHVKIEHHEKVNIPKKNHSFHFCGIGGNRLVLML
jgi:hypothetical protein